MSAIIGAALGVLAFTGSPPSVLSRRIAAPRLSSVPDDEQQRKLELQAELDRKLDAIFSYEQGSESAHLLERDGLLGTIDSSELLQRDEDAGLWPSQLSTDPDEPAMIFVDELSCIGCRYCATIARSTFSMCEGDSDFGTARVTQQGGDEDEVVEEAIDVPRQLHPRLQPCRPRGARKLP